MNKDQMYQLCEVLSSLGRQIRNRERHRDTQVSQIHDETRKWTSQVHDISTESRYQTLKHDFERDLATETRRADDARRCRDRATGNLVSLQRSYDLLVSLMVSGTIPLCPEAETTIRALGYVRPKEA